MSVRTKQRLAEARDSERGIHCHTASDPSLRCGMVAILRPHAARAEPRVIDDRYKLELVAKDPQIVTPIGMAFDRKGRMLVIESHTHQRPKGYRDRPAIAFGCSPIPMATGGSIIGPRLPKAFGMR